MPVRSNPAQAAADWVAGLAAAGPKIERGVQSVTQAPGAKAAQAADKYRQGVLDSVPKFVARSQAVSLGEWQAATVAGASRVAEGARLKEDKFTAALARVLPVLEQVVRQADAMPTLTIDQRIAKSSFVQREMHSRFRGGGAGRPAGGG